MRYVNRVRRANGEVHLFLRKPGLPQVRLPDGLSETDLARHVASLIQTLQPQPALPGTLGAALRAYELESANFRGLAASTKYEYRLILKQFEEDLGGLAVSVFTPALVQRLKEAWAIRGHRAANVRLQVLKNVLQPALVAGLLEKDPFPLVGQVRRPAGRAEPHLIWPAQVVEAVLRAAEARERFGLARAVAIARYAGARRGDLVVIPRTARENGRFRFLSSKRRVPVDIPEDPHLTQWLDSTPDTQPAEKRQGRKLRAGAVAIVSTTLVYNLTGAPYTEDGLALELAKLVKRLAKAGAIDSDRYDLHGLRHTRGVELALAGCTDAQGAAMMGHSSPSSFAQYRRQADRIRLADDAAEKVARLRERQPNENCNKDCNESATDPVWNETRPAN